MNVVEAVAAMNLGLRVERESWVGQTVARMWLTIERAIPEDKEESDFESEDEAKEAEIPVIYFNAEEITEAHNWVGRYPAIKNPWKPQQADLFADDFRILP